ncbi:MAG: hypothetical protein QXH27_03385 [Candidatus Micrarchaeia archaeon]
MPELVGLCHICGRPAVQSCSLCGLPTCERHIRGGVCEDHARGRKAPGERGPGRFL